MSEYKAGRELDALVAEKVMGAATHRSAGQTWEQREHGPWEPLKMYSTEIFAAWEVVEKMRDGGFGVWIGGRPDAWEVEVVDDGGLSFHLDDITTAPLAICLAALKALETLR